MVKPIKFEDWSQRFARHRAQKAVEKLNGERKLGIIFPILNVLTGLLVLYLISRLFFS
jgi:hypothetical protein